jgi:nucleoside-diphosphate-sugar epimerase
MSAQWDNVTTSPRDTTSAAVTGASGFFGAALVKALLGRGARVRALVRRDDAAAEMRSIGALPVLGDLSEPDGCEGLVEEGDVVFHAAARVDMSSPWREFQRTTIDGTRNLLAACLPHRPKRFVYISSGAVYAADDGQQSVCAERTPARPAAYNFYGRAKLEAERLVRSGCERHNCPWTILRLGFLYGAGNRALLNHFVPLAKLNRLFIIGSGDNRIATLFIDDAVDAALLAGTYSAAVNKVYDVASDERVTQREFIDATTDALGLSRTRRRIGRRAALVSAWMIERFARLIGRPAHISRAVVALMSADQVIDAGRIRAELGWRPQTGFLEGMRRAQDWHRRLFQEGAGGEGEGLPAPASRLSR